MNTGICHLSSICIRKEPSHRAEMVSQLIYGERYLVLEDEDLDWLKVQCVFDRYEGYIPKAQFSEFAFDNEPRLYAGSIAADEINNLVPKGAEIYKPESLVDVEEEELLTMSQIHFTPDQIKENIFYHSTSLLHTTYLWGGRTPWGMDCSGFTQIVFKLCNIILPRDSGDQQKLGESISLEESAIGDLAFFSNKTGSINHVGIVFGQQMIIHCSGLVRVDQLNIGGIINLDTGIRTHTLHSIKRIF